LQFIAFPAFTKEHAHIFGPSSVQVKQWLTVLICPKWTPLLSIRCWRFFATSSFLCCFFSPESHNKLCWQPQQRENASKMKRKQVTRRHISITIMVQKTMKKAIYETISKEWEKELSSPHGRWHIWFQCQPLPNLACVTYLGDLRA